MKLSKSFRREELPESKFETLPEGWYEAAVSDCRVKETKAGGGEYIEIDCQVVGGEHNGSLVRQMIITSHSNETAERIGLESLRKLLDAVKLDSLDDTDQLIGARVGIKVKIEKSQGYDPKNVVKAWRPAGTAQATASGFVGNKAAPQNGAVTGAPWNRAQ